MHFEYTFLTVILILASVLAQDHQHQHHGGEMNHDDEHQGHRVAVDVYYESLCPDSQKFITSQLYVTLQNKNLSDHVNLTLIPYGKSTVTKDNYGSINLNCHHGFKECDGNAIQACALKYINNGSNSEGLGYNKPALSFINCLMSKTVNKQNDTQFPIYDCSIVNQTPQVDQIENCVNHSFSIDELVRYGQMTDSLQKPLKSVPTIVFDKHFSEEDSQLAQKNFVRALCKHIKGDKPVECNGAATTRLTLAVLLLTVVSRAVF